MDTAYSSTLALRRCMYIYIGIWTHIGTLALRRWARWPSKTRKPCRSSAFTVRTICVICIICLICADQLCPSPPVSAVSLYLFCSCGGCGTWEVMLWRSCILSPASIACMQRFIAVMQECNACMQCMHCRHAMMPCMHAECIARAYMQ